MKTGEAATHTGRSERTHVTHERVESPEGCPSCTKDFCRIATKATDVRPNHRHLVHAGETKNAGDGVPVVNPITKVVSQPLADILASTGKCRAGDDERSQSRSAGKECIPGCRGH